MDELKKELDVQPEINNISANDCIRHIGINSIISKSRGNIDIKNPPPNPKTIVSPWILYHDIGKSTN